IGNVQREGQTIPCTLRRSAHADLQTEIFEAVRIARMRAAGSTTTSAATRMSRARSWCARSRRGRGARGEGSLPCGFRFLCTALGVRGFLRETLTLGFGAGDFRLMPCRSFGALTFRLRGLLYFALASGLQDPEPHAGATDREDRDEDSSDGANRQALLLLCSDLRELSLVVEHLLLLGLS